MDSVTSVLENVMVFNIIFEILFKMYPEASVLVNVVGLHHP